MINDNKKFENEARIMRDRRKKFMVEVLEMSKCCEQQFEDLKLYASSQEFSDELRTNSLNMAYEMHSWICFLRDFVEKHSALLTSAMYDIISLEKKTDKSFTTIGNTFKKFGERIKQIESRIETLEKHQEDQNGQPKRQKQ